VKKLLPIIISFAAISTASGQTKKKPRTAPVKKHHTAYHHKATAKRPVAKKVVPLPLPKPIDSFYLDENLDTTGLNISNNVRQLLATLESELGKPYIRGAIGPMAFDCSGLINFGFSVIGMTLPRTAADIGHLGSVITASEFVPGDLLFFSGRRKTKATAKQVHHVGCVYKVEDGKVLMIHSSNQGVNIVDITKSDYYKERLLYAKRLIEVDSNNVVIPPAGVNPSL
jgi:cell wall-associated NlpC family hydrolase